MRGERKALRSHVRVVAADANLELQFAVAGGYDETHLGGRDALPQAANAQGEYYKLSIDLQRLQVQVAQLRAAAAGKTDIDLGALRASAVELKLLDDLATVARRQLRTVTIRKAILRPIDQGDAEPDLRPRRGGIQPIGPVQGLQIDEPGTTG